MKRNFKLLREERRITLSALAKATGIGASTIGNFENGKTELSSEKLKILADFLRESPEKLMESVPEEQDRATVSVHIPYLHPGWLQRFFDILSADSVAIEGFVNEGRVPISLALAGPLMKLRKKEADIAKKPEVKS